MNIKEIGNVFHCDCGFSWHRGKNGNHNCADGLREKVRQLAAENVALKAAFNKPDAWLSWHSIPPTYQEPDRGGEYLAVHEQPGEKNDDGSDSWPVYAKPEIETPATDRIVAEAEARGVEKAIAHLEKKFSNIGVQIMNLQWLADSLRKGASE
ncbi:MULTISPECIES: hypothetical protein [Klebsiella]|uniref:hypothetical protein n=1 Tax=Klebsiella pneumoniae complex TaxID=3390273 RepID=UPI000C9BA19C|nr:MULTISPECIES: hypothetical protein [Klebsiella]MBX4677812.1 hypothetical protein [Klebsiella pneumoniae]MCS4333773.1 hypothetical protein [Klebsiella variicola subsp. variicola]